MHKPLCEKRLKREFHVIYHFIMILHIFSPLLNRADHVCHRMYYHHSTSNHALEARESIFPKPKRPLTCYGIFSVLERNYIWQQDQKSVRRNVSNDACGDPYAATRPERYRGLILPPNWFVVGMNRKKRSDYKQQSKISFQELSKTIAERWRSVDMETKIYCELIAANELERYRRDMAAYEEIHTEEGDKAKTTKTQKCDPCKAPLKDCKCHSVEENLSKHANASCDSYVQCMNEIADGQFCQECTPGVDGSTTKSQPAQLSDYLPDDRKEALELVGYNYENILSGEELGRAFDEDEDCAEDDVTYSPSVKEAASTSRVHAVSGQCHRPKHSHLSLLASVSSPEQKETSETAKTSPASRLSSGTPSLFVAFQQWYNREDRS